MKRHNAKKIIVIKNVIYALLALGIMFSGCEKFDDGGSVRNADKTITETLWKIQSAIDLEDGSDITGDYSGEAWEFTDDLKFMINSTLEGTYKFSDDKYTLIITDLSGSTDTYLIDRLDSEAMWLTILSEEALRFIPL